MNRERLSTLVTTLAGVVLLTATMESSRQVQAAGGDVILTRQVQTRVATRPPLVPDPNPLVVNTQPSTYVGDDLQMRGVPGELGDHDFAAVTSGARLPREQLLIPTQRNGAGVAAAVNHSALAGSHPVGHAGTALGNIEGQVNRSLEQGLRPLQMLQRP